MENATIQYGMTKEIIANHKLNVIITKWFFYALKYRSTISNNIAKKFCYV